jgi:formyl-CoA transferase/CoA:oxalate CoA-transferase
MSQLNSNIETNPTLGGIKVLDLTRNLAGPYCTMILGDLGADVIKIEHPKSGDDTRNWAPPDWNGVSTNFLSANRNKRSLAVDLNVPEGVDIILKLARQADVVVESFRPGSLEKRGLGFDDLKKENEGLIYCSLSGFGNKGPLRENPGYDPILQAFTGIMNMTGEEDGDPVRIPISLIDMGAGLWATIGVLSALITRQATGVGCHVETSLFETAAWWLNIHIAAYLATGISPPRQGTGTPFIAPYEVFPTADEGLFVGVANDKYFKKFVEVIQVPELATDERFATNPMRVKHRLELRQQISNRFQTRTASEWEKQLKAHSIPCTRIHTVADLLKEDQLNALDLLTAFPHPLIPDLRLVDLPVNQDGTRATHQFPPPMLGEHTDGILSDLGYSKADIGSLRENSVIA